MTSGRPPLPNLSSNKLHVQSSTLAARWALVGQSSGLADSLTANQKKSEMFKLISA